MTRLKVLRALLGFALPLAGATAAAAEEVVTVDTRPGVTENFLLDAPPSGAPVATLVLFSGDVGRINGGKSGNFLVRTRLGFAAQGFEVATVAPPSDRLATGMDEAFRTSAEHVTDVTAIIAELRRRVAVPVWLVGTSMGTVSAASIAARAPAGTIDGLALTSSIVANAGGTRAIPAVVDVAAIRVPVVVLHNREDACPLCPFALVPAFVAAFTHAPRTRLLTVSGGSPPRTGPCEEYSRHGYYGVEDQAVAAVSQAIKG